MSLPSDLPALPFGAVFLGRGREFSIPGFESTGFEGFACGPGGRWLEDTYLGTDQNMYYAVILGHPLAVLHGNAANQRHEIAVTEDQWAEVRKARLLQEFANDPDLRPVEPYADLAADVLALNKPDPQPVALTQEQAMAMTEKPINGWKLKGSEPGDSDPHGLDQHAPGAKLDAGKIRAGLLLGFSDALLAVAEVMTYGAEKYSAHGWKAVPNGEERYLDAGMRHLLQQHYEPRDRESTLLHLQHKAWNSLAELQLHIRPDSACPTPPQTPSTT